MGERGALRTSATNAARSASTGGRGLVIRSAWSTHWRSHLVLIGVIACTVGVTLALLTSAARSVKAFDRLRAATNAADAQIWHPDAERDPAGTLRAVAAIPGIESSVVTTQVFLRPAETEYVPDFDVLPIATLRDAGRSGLNLPVIAEGRAVDPRRPHEIALSEDFANELRVTVGDSITLESMTSAWVDVAFNGGNPGPPDGPRVVVDVVGLARSPADFGRWKGVVHVSPAFVERYGDDLRTYTVIEAQLTPHALALARSGAMALPDGVQVEASNFADDDDTADALGAISLALRLVALAAGCAGTVAVVVVLDRLTGLILRDRSTLTALGWTRAQHVAAVISALLPALFVGAGLGIALGIVASPVALVGLARRVDPTPTSIVLDGNVAVIVAAVTVALGLAIVAFIARRGVWRSPQARREAQRGELWHPLPMSLGARQALSSPAAQPGRASWGALAAVTAGVIAIVAALAVSASISRLVEDPRLTGGGVGRVIDSGESLDVMDRALPLLEADERVAVLGAVHVVFGIAADGSEVGTLTYDGRRGEPPASIVNGRMALHSDEVALGPLTLERLDKRVGDTVELRGDRGRADYEIVGSMLFPEGDFAHDDGLGMSVSGAERLVGL